MCNYTVHVQSSPLYEHFQNHPASLTHLFNIITDIKFHEWRRIDDRIPQSGIDYDTEFLLNTVHGYSLSYVHSLTVNRYCVSGSPHASKIVHRKVIAAIVTPKSILTDWEMTVETDNPHWFNGVSALFQTILFRLMQHHVTDHRPVRIQCFLWQLLYVWSSGRKITRGT